MSCATLAIAITIMTHANAHPAFSEAVFAKDPAGTSERLERVRVSRQGDIYFDHYGKCVSVRFTLKKNDQQLQFADHPLLIAKSNIDPFKEPAADDPDFQRVGVEQREDRAAPKMSLRFDWTSKITGKEYRLYQIELRAGGANSVTIDPKISNSGIS